MAELLVMIAPCVLGFYLIFAYSFFFFPYLLYVLGKHPFPDKLLRTFSFVLTPLFLPFLALVWVGWGLLNVLGGVVVVILFAWVAWLAWLNSRFPFGKVFKAWFQAANWVLQKVQRFLEKLGVKKLFFGVPISDLKLIEQA